MNHIQLPLVIDPDVYTCEHATFLTAEQPCPYEQDKWGEEDLCRCCDECREYCRWEI